jgi:hypothetical protein
MRMRGVRRCAGGGEAQGDSCQALQRRNKFLPFRVETRLEEVEVRLPQVADDLKG